MAEETPSSFLGEKQLLVHAVRHADTAGYAAAIMVAKFLIRGNPQHQKVKQDFENFLLNCAQEESLCEGNQVADFIKALSYRYNTSINGLKAGMSISVDDCSLDVRDCCERFSISCGPEFRCSIVMLLNFNKVNVYMGYKQPCIVWRRSDFKHHSRR